MELWVGKNREDMIGKNIWEVLPEAVPTKFFDYYHKAMKNRVAVSVMDYYEPTKQWLEVNVIPSSEGLVGYARNVTERINYKRLMEKLTYYDDLTRLPNQRMFLEQLDERISHAKSNKNSFAVICLDIDRLKNIIESLGMFAGDQLIKQFTSRLMMIMDGHGFVARMQGSEFAIIMKHQYNDIEKVTEAANRIVEIRNEPFFFEESEVHLTVSMGICLFPMHGEDVQTIMKHAQLSLSRAKDMGRGLYILFQQEMDIYAFKRYTIERDLWKAIKENSFELYYQPRVDTKTGRIVSAEALIRWNHSELGQLSPAEFIPVAEDSELIPALTQWVAESVCKQLNHWKEMKLSIVPVSINISARCLVRVGFPEEVQRILKRYQIDGKWLEVEVTETSLLENTKPVFAALEELKKQRIKIALDDFGTGYSSLAYLTKYPVDILKIDKSFAPNRNYPSRGTIVKSIINMAHGLGMRVVGEGIETREQLAFLKQQACDEIQGYVFSKPVPVERFQELLEIGIIRPSNNSVEQVNQINRRRYFRVQLLYPFLGQMTINNIKGKAIKLAKTEVLIENIGLGGLCFLSHIRLAVISVIILEFSLQIMGQTIDVCGHVVWSQEIDDNVYQYGIQFIMDEKTRDRFSKLLMDLELQLRKNPIVPNCDIVSVDRVNYVKNIVRQRTEV